MKETHCNGCISLLILIQLKSSSFLLPSTSGLCCAYFINLTDNCFHMVIQHFPYNMAHGDCAGFMQVPSYPTPHTPALISMMIVASVFDQLSSTSFVLTDVLLMNNNNWRNIFDATMLKIFILTLFFHHLFHHNHSSTSYSLNDFTRISHRKQFLKQLQIKYICLECDHKIFCFDI